MGGYTIVDNNSEELKKLTLCMIVRNEEERLPQCLKSVRDIVDEIIIVDTGSEDRTKEIALSFNASVYSYEWNDDFAAARNYGLEKSTGDWVLWLDADEEVDGENVDLLRNVLKEDKYWLGSVPIINYYGPLPASYNQAHLLAQYRLFRNNSKLRFRNAVHEQLDISELGLTKQSIITLPVNIHHYGYMDHEVEIKGKSERNLRLLEKEKQQEEYDPWIDYHIGSELYRSGELVMAFESVNTSIRRFLEKKSMPPSLLYKLKYSILLALGSYEGAKDGINFAIQLYPDYVDLHFYRGIIYMQSKEYAKALESFNHCLELKEVNTAHLIMVGVGSFYAHYYIGVCHQNLKNYEEAKDAYLKTLELLPDHRDAREALKLIEGSSAATSGAIGEKNEAR